MNGRYNQPPFHTQNQQYYPNTWGAEDFDDDDDDDDDGAWYLDPHSESLRRQRLSLSPSESEQRPRELDERETRGRELERQFLEENRLREEREQEERRREEQERQKGKGRETMSSWFQRATGSTQAQFAATALVSGAVVAGAIFGYQAVQRRERVNDLKREIPEEGRGHVVDKLTDFGGAIPLSKEDERSAELARRAQRGDYDDELILEQLARNRVFLTDGGLSKLRTAFIIVVGCGGVGSHCAAALARSGVTYIRLIDFDQVTLSSLNRHAVATLGDVGTSKVGTLKKRLQQITPWVRFDLCNELFSESAAERLLGPWIENGRKPDYVVDAIDNIDSKVQLLDYCYKNDLKVISSMGAGCKSDPTRIFIGDISSSTEDPLSRSTRQRLRKRGVEKGIPVVYSTEKPGPGKAQLLPLPEEEFKKGNVGDLGVLPEFRVRILPVLGTMPAVFGYCVANYVILAITGYPTEYVPAKGREKMYDPILAQLQGSEEKLARYTTPGEDAQGLKLPVTIGDVGFLVEETFKGKSAISGVPTRLTLVRWQKPTGSTIELGMEGQKSARVKLGDLVCMTREEAAVHEKEVLKGTKAIWDLYDRETVDLVERRIAEGVGMEQYR